MNADRKLLRGAIERLDHRATYAASVADMLRAEVRELEKGKAPHPELIELARAQMYEMNYAGRIERTVKLSARRGEVHHSAKLTDAQVAEIRATYQRGRYGEAKKFALRYGVSRQLIHMIVSGGHRASSPVQPAA